MTTWSDILGLRQAPQGASLNTQWMTQPQTPYINREQQYRNLYGTAPEPGTMFTQDMVSAAPSGYGMPPWQSQMPQQQMPTQTPVSQGLLGSLPLFQQPMPVAQGGFATGFTPQPVQQMPAYTQPGNGLITTPEQAQMERAQAQWQTMQQGMAEKYGGNLRGLLGF